MQAFVNGTGACGGPPIKADVSSVRACKSYIATWEHMEQQGSDPEAEAEEGIWEPPMHGMDREEFKTCAFTLRVKGTGKVSALVFPLWSRVNTEGEYEALDPDDRCRCVCRPAEKGTGWLYAPQTHYLCWGFTMCEPVPCQHRSPGSLG